MNCPRLISTLLCHRQERNFMQHTQARVLIRWTAIWFMVCVSLALPAYALSSSKGSCMPAFPLDASWQGADAAYSISLPDGATFGSWRYSLRKEPLASSSGDPLMVRNSIGISSCDRHGKATLDPVSAATQRRSEGLLHRTASAHLVLGMDGFFYNKSLWVTLLCVRMRRRLHLRRWGSRPAELIWPRSRAGQ